MPSLYLQACLVAVFCGLIFALAMAGNYAAAETKKEFQIAYQECRSGGAEYEIIIKDSRAIVEQRKKGSTYCDKPCIVTWKDFTGERRSSKIECFATMDHRNLVEPYIQDIGTFSLADESAALKLPTGSPASTALAEYVLTGSSEALAVFQESAAKQGFNTIEGTGLQMVSADQLLRKIAEAPASVRGAEQASTWHTEQPLQNAFALSPPEIAAGFSDHPKNSFPTPSVTAFSHDGSAQQDPVPLSAWLQGQADRLRNYAAEREKTPWMYSMGQPVEDPFAWSARLGAAVTEGWAFIFERIGF